MSTTYGNIENVNKGACKIYVDRGGGAGYEPVGFTTDTFQLSQEPNWEDVTSWQTGENTPIDSYFKGATGSISFGVLEKTMKNLKLMIPTGVLYTNGTKTAFANGLPMDAKLSDYAVKVKLHPINKRGTAGADDETYVDDDIIAWKCASTKGVQMDLKGGKVVWNMELAILADTTKPSDYQLWIEGDPAIIGIVNVAPALATTSGELVGMEAEKSGGWTEVPAGATGLTDVLATSNLRVTMNQLIDSAIDTDHVALINLADNSVVAGVVTSETVTLDDAGAVEHIVTRITFNPTASLTASGTYLFVVGGLVGLTGLVMSPVSRMITVAA